MRKFSILTNQKVGEEPKKELKQFNEEDIFKAKVMNLMENFLTIQTYGPIDRYLRAGNIKISGKETFLEALMSLMSDTSLKGQAKILESLKGQIKDWDAIDTKIQGVNEEIAKSSEKNKTLSHRNKLSSLFEKYGQDEELMVQIAEQDSKKIKSAESAKLRAITAEYMSEEGKYPTTAFKLIAETFYARYKEIKG
jgi:hypothetical protein